jgi:hypothetical protein
VITRDVLKNRRVQSAIGALVVAASFAIRSLVMALRIEPVPEAAPPQFNTAAALPAASNAKALNVSAVVSENLFSPDRSPPLTRYRLPGNEDAYVEAEPIDVSQLLVLGTVVGAGNRTFAMCSLNGAPTVIVRVGERVGDFTVRSIKRGVVEFSTASGERFEINANPT